MTLYNENAALSVTFVLKVDKIFGFMQISKKNILDK